MYDLKFIDFQKSDFTRRNVSDFQYAEKIKIIKFFKNVIVINNGLMPEATTDNKVVDKVSPLLRQL